MPRPREDCRPSATKHEAMLAYATSKIGMHRPDQRPHRARSRSSRVATTRPNPCPRAASSNHGRPVIFNDILPTACRFYNYPLSNKGAEPRHRRLLRHARPCRDDRPARQHQGRSASSTPRWRACRSASPTCAVPANKQKILDAAQKQVDRVERGFHQGAITEASATTSSIDVWIHAREQVTEEMLDELRNDLRDENGKMSRPSDPRASPISTRSA